MMFLQPLSSASYTKKMEAFFQGLEAERQEGQEAEDIGKRMTELMSMKSQMVQGSDDGGAYSCLEILLGLNNCLVGIHATRELDE